MRSCAPRESTYIMCHAMVALPWLINTRFFLGDARNYLEPLDLPLNCGLLVRVHCNSATIAFVDLRGLCVYVLHRNRKGRPMTRDTGEDESVSLSLSMCVCVCQVQHGRSVCNTKALLAQIRLANTDVEQHHLLVLSLSLFSAVLSTFMLSRLWSNQSVGHGPTQIMRSQRTRGAPVRDSRTILRGFVHDLIEPRGGEKLEAVIVM